MSNESQVTAEQKKQPVGDTLVEGNVDTVINNSKVVDDCQLVPAKGADVSGEEKHDSGFWDKVGDFFGNISFPKLGLAIGLPILLIGGVILVFFLLKD